MHDTNAHQDEKITRLFIKYGYEGTGLFFAILERIAYHEKPVNTEVLKRQLQVGKKLEKIWQYIEQIGLISSKNDETFNENVLKFAQKYQEKKEKNRERVSQWRDNQQDPKSVTHYESVRNKPNKTRLDQTKPDSNNNNDANAPGESDLFDTFWDLYKKKKDTKKCRIRFNKFSRKVQLEIIEHVPVYVKSTPNVHYRKNPLTYLNGEIWNDPIEESKQAANEMVY